MIDGITQLPYSGVRRPRWALLLFRFANLHVMICRLADFVTLTRLASNIVAMRLFEIADQASESLLGRQIDSGEGECETNPRVKGVLHEVRLNPQRGNLPPVV